MTLRPGQQFEESNGAPALPSTSFFAESFGLYDTRHKGFQRLVGVQTDWYNTHIHQDMSQLQHPSCMVEARPAGLAEDSSAVTGFARAVFPVDNRQGWLIMGTWVMFSHSGERVFGCRHGSWELSFSRS